MEIQRHGKTVATIRPKLGVSGKELRRLLDGLDWTDEERKAIKGAMDAAGEVIVYAGRD